MPITSIDLIKESSSIDQARLASTTETYRVVAPIAMKSNAVRGDLGFTILDPHPDDDAQFLNRINVDLETETIGYEAGAEVYTWVATLEYGPWNPENASESGDPTEADLKVAFESVTFEEAVDLDLDGLPVVNTAGDYFDPPVMRDRTRPIIRITRNELTFSDSTILAYSDKINSDTFYSYPPGTLKCDPPVAEKLYSQYLAGYYYKVEYRLVYREDTWKAKVLNQGYRELKTIDSVVKQVAIVDGQGQPISSPAFLDAAGVQLTQPIDDTNIVQLEFDVYEELDFTTTFAFPTGILS